MKWSKQKVILKKKKSQSAKNDLFSVPLIGAFVHTPETRRVLGSTDNSTFFIREAIANRAKELGFVPLEYGADKPDYITCSLWGKIVLAQQKSYHVDYNYVIAFYWLKSLPKYHGYTKSKLIREIIS